MAGCCSQERDENPAIDPDRWGFVGGHLDNSEEFEPGGVPGARRGDRDRAAGKIVSLWLDAAAFHRGDRHRQRSAGLGRRHRAGRRRHRRREGRQIVFVDPTRALDLDLAASAARILPQFLSSADYRNLVNP